jgi:hypothetical protein
MTDATVVIEGPIKPTGVGTFYNSSGQREYFKMAGGDLVLPANNDRFSSGALRTVANCRASVRLSEVGDEGVSKSHYIEDTDVPRKTAAPASGSEDDVKFYDILRGSEGQRLSGISYRGGDLVVQRDGFVTDEAVTAKIDALREINRTVEGKNTYNEQRALEREAIEGGQYIHDASYTRQKDGTIGDNSKRAINIQHSLPPLFISL